MQLPTFVALIVRCTVRRNMFKGKRRIIISCTIFPHGYEKDSLWLLKALCRFFTTQTQSLSAPYVWAVVMGHILAICCHHAHHLLPYLSRRLDWHFLNFCRAVSRHSQYTLLSQFLRLHWIQSSYYILGDCALSIVRGSGTIVRRLMTVIAYSMLTLLTLRVVYWLLRWTNVPSWLLQCSEQYLRVHGSIDPSVSSFHLALVREWVIWWYIY
jgi:hypothetical protein